MKKHKLTRSSNVANLVSCKLLRILGHSTAEKKEMESRERAKIVNFSNIKLWHSPKPTTIKPPNLIAKEDSKDKKGHTKKSTGRYQNFKDRHALKQLQTKMK